ncbi:MAG: PKD domain-containing protein [bacterium]
MSLFIVSGCVQERPPRTPVVGGPNAAQPGETLRWWAITTDPNHDHICYLFDWGDGSEPETSPEIRSGDTMFMCHCYPESGIYPVQVQARDEKGNRSERSMPVEVEVNFFGPLTPSKPAGPSVCYPDTALVFSTVVQHRFNLPVAVQFDFGDTVSSWTGFYPAGCTIAVAHTYHHRGRFLVRARAKDETGQTSPWSETTPVLIDFPPLKQPRDLRLNAQFGIFVRLRWDSGQNHDSVRYVVWFRQVDSTRFLLLDSTTSNSFVHDPLGTTGDYTVSARFRNNELFARETVSTIPVFTDTLLLSELNCQGDAGYGWDSIRYTGQTFSMRDSGSVAQCRFYLTDFSPESLSLNYFLASVHLGPEDPGGVVPAGTWHQTWLCTITGNSNAPLPEFDLQLYQDRLLLGTGTTEIAVYLPSDNYCLLRLFPGSSHRFKLVSWYQPVPGLRLIYPQGSEK